MATRIHLAQNAISAILRKCLVLSLLIPCAAGLSCASSSGTYAMSVSTQANRSGAVALNGGTLSGDAYVFTSHASRGINQVCYWLDNTAMSGTATRCASITPYDFAGSVSNSLANPWNTAVLANGTHTITQFVTKSSGRTETDTATFTIQNGGSTPALAPTPTPAPLSMTTSSLPNGSVKVAYSAALTAAGGTAPYTWSVVSGSMGAGLTLSTSGTISGTPTTAGQNTFSVQAKDSASTPQAATSTMTLTVAPALPSVASGVLPTATVNTAYSTTLTGSGGTAPYTWNIATGSLPGGVSLASSGVVAGTPTATGTFAFTVRLTDATGLTASANSSLTVASSSSPVFQKFYSSTSFWNTPIASNPAIDPNSTADVQASILNFLADDITFSNGAYGMPLAYATSANKVYTVPCTMYSSESCTVGGAGVKFPIPAGAQVATGTDHHLVVAYHALDGSPYAGMELDMWEASYNASNDTWSADTVTVNNLFGWGAGCSPGQHCLGGNVAAGFAGLGGAVRPEEIAQGHIDHALAMATPYNLINYIACPAVHSDGSASGPALPEGAQIQLDPTFNVAAQNWPAWEKTIAVALQKYGAYVRDYSGVVIIYGVTDQNAGVPNWSSVGVPIDSYGALNQIPWSQMRVLNITSCN
jgi:hypothetical protein